MTCTQLYSLALRVAEVVFYFVLEYNKHFDYIITIFTTLSCNKTYQTKG